MSEDYKLITTLVRSLKMREVLQILVDTKIPLDSKTILNEYKRKHEFWMQQTNVIRILNSLSDLHAIQEVAGVKRGRMYIIAEKGKEALSALQR